MVTKVEMCSARVLWGAACQPACTYHTCSFHTRVPALTGSESVPVYRWTSLESLTIYGIRFWCQSSIGLPVQWLTKRLELGWPRLSVRPSGLSSEPAAGVCLHALYNKLQTCSKPGMDNMELHSGVHCSTLNGLFQLVGVRPC